MFNGFGLIIAVAIPCLLSGIWRFVPPTLIACAITNNLGLLGPGPNKNMKLCWFVLCRVVVLLLEVQNYYIRNSIIIHVIIEAEDV